MFSSKQRWGPCSHPQLGGGETWVLILPLLSPGLPICNKQKLGTSLLGGGGRTLDMTGVHFRDRAEKQGCPGVACVG